ncbi:MAG: ClpXP protease specificity-enhancing factor SspB [Pseudomonadota bacterium]
MKDYIGYDALTQAASRGIVRQALLEVAEAGTPPGEHHFYVTFLTKAPGVKMAPQLIERFPEDITIVIQHQFWNLEVFDNHFEIVLKFGGVPQHLVIPFASITRFVDPSVKFGLAFDVEGASERVNVLSPVEGSLEEDDTEAGQSLVGDTDGNTVVNLDAFRRK